MLRVGIIGCGSIAKRAHIPGYLSLPDVKLEALADLSKHAVHTCAEQFKVERIFTDYRDMLEKGDIDAVSICTPSETHAEIMKDAAEYGIHTLVEKPMATSVSDALAMINCAERRSTKMSVAYVYRYVPTLRRIKLLIEQGEVGRIVQLDIQHHGSIPLGWARSTWLYKDPTGFLWDSVPHFVDVLLWLGGEYESIHSYVGDFIGTMRIPNYVTALVKFRDGSVGTLESSWVTGCFIQTLEVHCTGGYLFSNVRDDVMKMSYGYVFPYQDVKYEIRRLIKIGKAILDGRYFRGFITLHQNLIADFVSCINEDAQPPIPGTEAIQSVRAIENMLNMRD